MWNVHVDEKQNKKKCPDNEGRDQLWLVGVKIADVVRLRQVLSVNSGCLPLANNIASISSCLSINSPHRDNRLLFSGHISA